MEQTTYLFTFGDSYTQTDFDPSGTKPSLSNPMGNPKLGTCTSSGGINWVGYLVTSNPGILSFNLAAGGATIDKAMIHSDARDLVSQINLFGEHYCPRDGGKAVPWTSENAVFGIWIGINEYEPTVYSNDLYFNDSVGLSFEGKTPPIQSLMNRYAAQMERLYDEGARRFLFLNVPPTSRSPLIGLQGSQVENRHAEWVKAFNDALGQMVRAVLYDTWSFMTAILDDPEKYGFENSEDGAEQIWWNDYHPSSRYHRLQVEDMGDVINMI
ncbi:hypothetical protein ASPZODRAFT_2127732 [Penicilliopsis zonata CBS 506.65]|uniref:SGNH hydrolase-type esterase domain-containing protein n=1 Tax=Penicilliopsis zonata CBS 506.65 TaxID=1073090 RepID=A0A1L9SI71_9EURO|nr:hypothetical protein ASPZODRAFT_2127732 [Penicilliopsis zonata CBS 506.65]OJJ46922.1 hypothetical protein ASPZODRAFT_2127732 [Penicilliopsis zonata CBS 506.65]